MGVCSGWGDYQEEGIVMELIDGGRIARDWEVLANARD